MRKNWNKIWKGITSVILGAGLMAASGFSGLFNEVKDQSVVNAAGSGETITFGNFWQDDTNGNGVADRNDSKTPLTWRILYIYDDGTALVLADKVLANVSYYNGHDANGDGTVSWYDDDGNYTGDYDCTWETSTIRSWLNSNFYNDAFSANEKSAIIKSTLKNEDDPKTGTKGGNDTQDNIFLLSLQEVTNASYGFTSDYNKSDIRVAKVTEFASEKGISVAEESGVRWWWLRSPGANSSLASVVRNDGGIMNRQVEYEFINGVRPAIKVDLLSPYVIYAGKEELKKQIGESGKSGSGKGSAGTTKYSNEWVDGKWYDADGSQTYKASLSWKSDAKGWWVEDSSGWYPTSKWQKIDGKWYYFCADGYMDYSEYRDGCWLNADGSMADGYTGGHWNNDANGWWYEDNGWYPVSQYVWIDGVQYWFGADGYWK